MITLKIDMTTNENYYLKTLIAFWMKLILKMAIKILPAIIFFYFSNYSTKSKYYNNSSKLVISKTINESRSIAIEELDPLKLKSIHS